jgi:hypothetical protein
VGGAADGGVIDAGLSTGADGSTAGGGASTFLVTPVLAEVTVTRGDQPVTQAFSARSAAGQPVEVTWSLDRSDLGEVDANGVFTTRSMAGGVVTLTATTATGERVSVQVTVRVRLSDNGLPDGGFVVPPNLLALLDQAERADAGATSGPRVVYPYANTIFPRGILSPLVQYTLGAAPSASRLTITAPFFTWTGSFTVSTPQRPNIVIPEGVWDGALRSANGNRFSLLVTATTSSAAFGPSEVPVTAAAGSLKGSVYYMTYATSQLGVWRVKTGTKEPPTHVVTDCTVCHSVSANGQRLVTGGENSGGGVFTLLPDAGMSRVAGPPSVLGGDSRGLSMAVLTPDGKYVLRSRFNFWGGREQKAFRIDEAQGQLREANVVGMGMSVAAYLPTVSPDGRFFAFTQGELSPRLPNTSRALKLMDLTIDEAAGPAGTLTFSNERTIVDNGPTGPVVKFVTFLPSTRRLVFQESTDSCNNHDFMLPTWNASCAYHSRSPGRLMHVDTSSSPPTVLSLGRANAGLAGEAEWQNYEPFALPFVAGGLYWVAFTSIRPYGNVFPAGENRKQLWVTAIDPRAPAGTDPSAPAFYLPNQLPTENERGYWALDPCRPTGLECTSGDECCDGFCRAPQPGSPRVCAPSQQTCSQSNERCRLDADCCPPLEGPPLQCLAGFCTVGSGGDGGIPEIQ